MSNTLTIDLNDFLILFCVHQFVTNQRPKPRTTKNTKKNFKIHKNVIEF